MFLVREPNYFRVLIRRWSGYGKYSVHIHHHIDCAIVPS